MVLFIYSTVRDFRGSDAILQAHGGCPVVNNMPAIPLIPRWVLDVHDTDSYTAHQFIQVGIYECYIDILNKIWRCVILHWSCIDNPINVSIVSVLCLQIVMPYTCTTCGCTCLLHNKWLKSILIKCKWYFFKTMTDR